MVIKVLYYIFLAIMIVVFISWTLLSIYPIPSWEEVYPGTERYGYSYEYPPAEELKVLNSVEKKAAIEEYKARKKEHDMKEKVFENKIEQQGKTVSIFSLALAVLSMALGVIFSKRMPIVSEGLLLGGVFTLIFSVIWCLNQSPKIGIFTVGIGLLATIILGYIQFVLPETKKSASTS